MLISILTRQLFEVLMNNVNIFPSQVWRNSVISLFLLVSIDFFVFKGSFAGMWSIWGRSETFAHGFVVPPISLWLIWRKREYILVEVPRPNFWFLVSLFFVIIIWFLGDTVAVGSVTQFMAVASIVLLVPILFGYSIFKVILFPLCFLFFAVPFGEFLFPQLMEWTADFTVLALRFSGVPVYREGLQFVIPSGNWSVVEACSGIRYLISSVTVGALFAYLNYKSICRRFIFVLISIAVPIFANWIRAYLIVILGHLSANKIATGVDHIIYGWLFFGFVIAVMFWVGARWSESSIEFEASSNLAPKSITFNSGAGYFGVSCAAALLLICPLLLKAVVDSDSPNGFNSSVDFSNIKLGWVSKDDAHLGLLPSYKNTALKFSGSFEKDGKTVDAFFGYYARQNYAHKMISSDNVLVVSSDPHWSKISSGVNSIDVRSHVIPMRTTVLRGVGFPGGEVRLAVWQFYWINGFITNSDYVAIVYSAFQKLLGHGDESVVVVLSSKIVDGVDANDAMGKFLVDNYKNINTIFHGVKN
jgi:exosortase A